MLDDLEDQKNSPKSLWGMPQRNYWWFIIVAKYGTFLFTENGALVITDYRIQ
ncbi:hypothetical protein [Aquiflexum balticum]|uniref:hypothetical protein n=1 Tax=Aquiflexum balticum TaxID=280473 RepID=UPI0012FBCA52|nr:hypothetical protein [Aquiflexum balticum]